VYCALTVRFSLLRRVFGVKADDDGKLPSVHAVAVVLCSICTHHTAIV